MDVVVSCRIQSHAKWGDTPQAIGRHVIEDATIERYRTGRLSHRQVGEALGIDYWQTETFLKERGVLLNYSATDLEADAATLEKILVPRS
jgi:predicted HTH domain antitoxin